MYTRIRVLVPTLCVGTRLFRRSASDPTTRSVTSSAFPRRAWERGFRLLCRHCWPSWQSSIAAPPAPRQRRRSWSLIPISTRAVRPRPAGRFPAGRAAGSIARFSKSPATATTATTGNVRAALRPVDCIGSRCGHGASAAAAPASRAPDSPIATKRSATPGPGMATSFGRPTA